MFFTCPARFRKSARIEGRASNEVHAVTSKHRMAAFAPLT